jgi:membrane protein DedA with SNARE-associated domain
MQQLVFLLEQYGLTFVFLHVLAEQAGIPLPAYPTLIVASALAAR